MKSVLILTKRNIKTKKNIFLEIMFLVFMIVFSVIPTISNTANTKSAVKESLERTNVGDITILIYDELYTTEIQESLKKHNDVKYMEEKSFIQIVGNSYFNDNPSSDIQLLDTYSNNTRVYNDDFTDFDENFIELKKGEILLPYKLKDLDWITIGAEYSIDVGNYKEKFIVKGFYDDPMFGYRTSLYTKALINEEDYERLKQNTSQIYDSNRAFLLFNNIQVFLKDKKDIDSFKSELEKESGLVNNSEQIITLEEFREEGEMYANIGTKMVYIFESLLFIVILIVMNNSINSTIEQEYKELGILKSQGFSINKIRQIFINQYVFASIIGSILGIICAIPLTNKTINLFMTVTCILTDNTIVIKESIILIISVISLCTLFAYIFTSKVKYISPVKTIKNTKKIKFFNKIKSKNLTFSLSLRKLLSNVNSYIGTIIIISILVFFISSISILTSGVNLNNIFSLLSGDITITSNDVITKEILEDIEVKSKTIDNKANIHAKGTVTMLVEDQMIEVHTFFNEKDMYKIKDGRQPNKDNEIIITEKISEELSKGIGDTITIKNNNITKEYIVTGTFETIFGFGNVVAINNNAAKRISFNAYNECYIELNDKIKINEVITLISSDNIKLTKYETNKTLETYKDIINTLLDIVTYVIYFVSIIFVIIVVLMMTNKAFFKEKNDIGIYKSLGFKTNSLRKEFAMRFGIISLIGSIIGVILSLIFAESMLSLILKTIGLTNFIEPTIMVYIVPTIIITCSFIIFAFLFSYKIKSINIKELITE